MLEQYHLRTVLLLLLDFDEGIVKQLNEIYGLVVQK